MVIFNEAKPKYEKLNELLEEQLNDIRFTNQVNIIVDVKELSKKFFRPDVLVDDKNRRSLIEEISSDIINLISHYRNYFYKRGKYTSFYFLYSFEKCPEFSKDFPDYKKEYYEKYIEGTDPKVSLIKKALQVVQATVNIIPNSHFIETSDYDEYIYCKYITTQIVRENELTIIISNDDIFYQLVKKNVFILNPKGIKSTLVKKENCLQLLSERDNLKISSNLVPLVLSLSGIKRYSLDTIPNVGILKAITIVEKLKDREIVKDEDTIEIPLEFSKLNPKLPYEKKVIDYQDKIIKNYEIIRGDKVLYSNRLSIMNKFIFTKPANVSATFMELNAKIFVTYPLQLDMLLKGEKI